MDETRGPVSVSYAARERAERSLALLGETATRLGTTLDLATTADELAHFVVDHLADYCSVQLLERYLVPDGDLEGAVIRLRRVGMRVRAEATEVPSPPATPFPQHARDLPDDAPAVGALAVLAPDHPISRVLTGGEPLLLPEVERPHLRDVVSDGPTYRGLAHLGLHSLLVVPLRARREIVGCAVLGRFAGSPAFDAADLELTGQLADRAALAVDNALLYHRERRTALTLQRSLLPQGQLELAAADVAHRYLPGSSSTEVGGDWYDVIPLAGGRVAFVVGDVMGRGLRAAAAMGQLRIAVRTLAVLDLLPEDIVGHLDDVAQSLEAVQLATCVYAVWDAAGRTLTYASAGHLPPVLRHCDGAAELGPLTSGAPLGVGGVPFDQAELHLPEGARLVLCTDGLVESRDLDVEDGLDHLARAVAETNGPLEHVADALLAAMGREAAHDDDVALLVTDLEPLPAEWVTQWSIPSDFTAVAEARRLTADVLRGWGLAGLIESAQLVVSEVVTNAIRYARHPIVVRWVRTEEPASGRRPAQAVVVCEVSDDDTRLPRVRRAGLDDEGGRGLHLVSTLATRWGTRPTSHGKVVWFQLQTPWTLAPAQRSASEPG